MTANALHLLRSVLKQVLKLLMHHREILAGM